jgi:hypothetical protein
MNKTIEQLNTRFHTGSSDERYCDCLGLIFLHMRLNGYRPIDERSIPRGMTKHREIQEWLIKFNCTEVDRSTDADWLIALMYYDDENGHLGVYFPEDDAIHHMAPFGKCTTRPGINTTFWRYDGR